ncbi:AraD1 family protein [Herbaspirillum sp. VT-16-41]|uniref:AraD1 family protein n=1 Tax=Herbaspirillum sp. VT-16-41 TaxID=1953765 RepID=UPI000980EAD0|nr:AraD1 family protein [Herbaspirillum sp. VT-16-41]ONN68608.1 FAH family protein [Herbaspirillum sp. VT-16-41]
MRLIQYRDRKGERRVGIVNGSHIQALDQVATMRELALLALQRSTGLERQAQLLNTDQSEDYAAILAEARILAPLDHPDPAHCRVSGAGTTHLGSATTRDKMHRRLEGDELDKTDTQLMIEWGIAGGRPAPGQVGVQPEWFYKGDGSSVVAPGQPLPRPDFALDGGEEPEIVGLYLIDDQGCPRRLGFAIGNEFSDHVMERRNYLYQGHSKLRHCSFGPELLVGLPPAHLVGMTRIRRKGRVIWEQEFLTGQDNMCHSIENLEYHYFKYSHLLHAGDVHVHFMGAANLSFAYSLRTEDGDSIEISIPDFGAPLVNGIAHVTSTFRAGGVKPL